MDNQFNEYEYHLIRKFTSMCYGRNTSLIDQIKLRNKSSIWHDLLKFLLIPDGVLKVYKVEFKSYLGASTASLPSNYVMKNPTPDDPDYISEMIENYPLRLLTFLKTELNRRMVSLNIPYSTPLSRYLQRYHIVEMNLDNILKSGDDSKLPFEIFHCPNVKILSLKHNHLRQIPSAIGRLSKLEVLILTDNLLTVQSIPFSLTFCTSLKELYVDDNQLEALPGFITRMDHLELVYRLGNRNYFKSFFLWYHTDFDHRARKEIWKNYWIRGEAGPRSKFPSLLDITIEKVFSSGINFFEAEIPESLKHYMSLTYLNYNICTYCNAATDCLKPGYSTVTFLTPYLGNTCVPFQHWACSNECVTAIEGPAKHLQQEGSKRLDHEYSHYIARSNITDETRRKLKVKRDRCCIC